ncbi:hypothetical protein P9057_11745 [Gallibacterium anatis]|uniref:Uncharacterized protein n=1 Tax=Gallibacterium anatis TaxID=750 RepID=A0AAX3XD36_9PAST|nr:MULTISPECIES: hypothetical protein [Gallibacterium]MDK9430911.1 hypothetical protein [Gallibacterium anatis]MDK9560930.1 hypothetical protein [Gallibacterium anatis]WIM80113.1 hypothetical protein QP018_02425 [Gallibacterium anatis]WKS96372.1 hypothetical protein NYR19_07540 [Gallibacterium anatis]
MIKYTPKHQVKVGGNMSKEGADKVGKMLATAAIIFALGFAICAICIGISYLIR